MFDKEKLPCRLFWLIIPHNEQVFEVYASSCIINFSASGAYSSLLENICWGLPRAHVNVLQVILQLIFLCLSDHFMSVKLGKNDDIEIFKQPADRLFVYSSIRFLMRFLILPKLVSFSMDVDC